MSSKVGRATLLASVVVGALLMAIFYGVESETHGQTFLSLDAGSEWFTTDALIALNFAFFFGGSFLIVSILIPVSNSFKISPVWARRASVVVINCSIVISFSSILIQAALQPVPFEKSPFRASCFYAIFLTNLPFYWLHRREQRLLWLVGYVLFLGGFRV